MEVRLKPETEARLHALAAESGRSPDDLVQDAMAGYLMEVAEPREMLDKRYDDMANGTVQALDGEKVFVQIRMNGRDLRG